MTVAVPRFAGPLAALGPDDRQLLFERGTSADPTVRARTAEIVERVRRDGDGALIALASELDGARLHSMEVPRDAWRAALAQLDPKLRKALERTARNIERAHRAFMPRAVEVETEPGILVGRRPDPLRRVGIYAPGGRAAYASSLLMAAVPARVAGVESVLVCSPPNRSGSPSPVVLAAAELARADRFFCIGGAGAIAAMAYGTRTVPKVDRIVGPGNAYVAEAKVQVSAAVAIDTPAGPSELLAIADESAEPRAIAREMVAQAEHDPRSCVLAIALSESVAARIQAALVEVVSADGRAEVRESLSARGGVLWARSTEEALEFAEEFAPEHLLLAIANPGAAFTLVRNAGAAFLGQSSAVPFGDYMTGANHVLPTGGWARSASGLSVLDFVRWTSYQKVDPSAAARLADDVALLADSEGLPAHAAAARAWKGRP